MDASKVVNKYTQEVDRFTLDRLDVCFCPRCRDLISPEVQEDDTVCPFCSSEVSEYDSVIDAVCDGGLVSCLHRSIPDEV
jgi:hypothetical protein